MSDVKVGHAAPEFALTCINAGDDRPRPVSLRDYAGRWLMLIFCSRDFTFVCPTDFGLAASQRMSSREDGGNVGQELTAADVSEVVDGIEATVEFVGFATNESAGIKGSLAYMSPEQALGSPATPASDVFSFGITLVELLTGQRAHPEQPPGKLIARLQTEDLTSELVRDVDDAYRDLVIPMLAREADQRPSMGDVVRRLDAVAVS